MEYDTLVIFPRPFADSFNGLLCMFPDLCFICFSATLTAEPRLCWKWQIISCFAWAKSFFPHPVSGESRRMCLSPNPEAGPFSFLRDGERKESERKEWKGEEEVEEWKAKASAMQMGALQP